MKNKENRLWKMQSYTAFFSLTVLLFPLHFVTQSKMDENSNDSGYNSSIWGKIMLIEAVKTSAANLASVWTCFPDEKTNILLRGKEVKRKCSFFFLFWLLFEISIVGERQV